MMGIVIFGPPEIVVGQMIELRKLVNKYHLVFNENAHRTHIWFSKKDGQIILMCGHYEINATLTGSPEKDLPLRRFLIEAMKLSGVFLSCPECTKRTSWEKLEVTLLTSSASISKR